ncbi:MAG: T9SS type A sorting domain-containing protein [Bacteroidia bacterium]
MKKNLLLTVALGTALTANAQKQWVPQATLIPVTGTTTKFANDINVVDKDNVWAWFRSSVATTNLRQYSYTTNGGTTWKPKTLTATGLTITNLEIANMSVIDSNYAFASLYPPAATATNQGIYKTVNGGLSWTKSTVGKFTAGSSFVNWVHFWDKAKGVCMGDPANGGFEIYTTADSGTTWTRIDTTMMPVLIPTDVDEYGIVNLFDAQPNGLVWFGTNHGRLFKSTDYGMTWTVSASGFSALGNTTQAFTTIQFKNDTVGVIVSQHVTSNQVDTVNVQLTIDGGATFTKWNYAGQWNPSDVCFVPGTNNVITVNSLQLAPAFTYQVGSTISTDGGATFGYQDSINLLTSVAFVNDTVGYAGGSVSSAGGSKGVYKWADAPLVKLASVVAATNSLSVYPNPANNVLNVLVPSKKAQVIVYNMLGEMVYTTAVNDGRLTLDITNYTSGAYVVQVIDGKTKLTKKFIKE